MIRQFFSTLLLTAFVLTAIPVTQCYAVSTQSKSEGTQTWALDPAHTKASFSIRHMMISNVTGSFDTVTGSVRYDSTNLGNACVEATMPASSINTANPQRDAHLKSPDFLDATKYPTIIFKSKTIIPVSEHQAKIIGDLTMHGVTRDIVLDLQEITPPIIDPQGKTRIGATATAALNRKDFGINFNKTIDNGGALVGDEVYINLEVELVKSK